MLIKADAAQLEWRVKVFLAQDPLAVKEIEDLEWKPKSEDLHSDNKNAFRLPNRTVAKNFLYRMIFIDAFGPRGFSTPAYAYANDPDFMHVSSSTKFWEGVVERFFVKYPGIYNHGVNSIRSVTETGLIVSPSGRFYEFKQYKRPNGEWDWPRTNILNYPVQGLAADFMVIARRLAWVLIRSKEWFDPERILFMSTVHDDIELDVDNDPFLVYNISIELEKCFTGIAQEFEKQFGVVVNVPQAGEVKFGLTLNEKDMVTFNSKEDFEPQWESALIKPRPLQ